MRTEPWLRPWWRRDKGPKKIIQKYPYSKILGTKINFRPNIYMLLFKTMSGVMIIRLIYKNNITHDKEDILKRSHHIILSNKKKIICCLKRVIKLKKKNHFIKKIMTFILGQGKNVIHLFERCTWAIGLPPPISITFIW